jgi:hypothetical protein
MKYKITIPKPCHVDWTTMTPTQKGKFCKSCSKEVIDFTKLSTSQISNKVLKQDNICGRFKETQLHTEIETVQKSNLLKIAASLVLVSAISISEPVFSQSKKETIAVSNHQQGKFFIRKDSIDKFRIIKGIVKDKYESLPGASIVLKGTKIGAVTDFDGNFSIKIPHKNLKSHILVISYLGFKVEEVAVMSINKSLLIRLEPFNTELLGEIIITTGMISIDKKPSIIKKTDNFRGLKNSKNKND